MKHPLVITVTIITTVAGLITALVTISDGFSKAVASTDAVKGIERRVSRNEKRFDKLNGRQKVMSENLDAIAWKLGLRPKKYIEEED